MKRNLLLSIVMVAFTLMSCSASNAEGSASAPAKGKTDNKMTKVKLETTLGDIVVELYNETPQHRDNFIKLVKEGYYNGVLFHRVIKDFMIQTGDGNSKNAGPETTLATPSRPSLSIPSISTSVAHWRQLALPIK